MILGYSLLIATVGIVKSRIAEKRHDFWFKPPKDPGPPKTAKQKAKERLKILKVLCFGAFLSGVLGRLAVPLGAIFLLLLALWTIFGPIIIAFIYYLTNPNLLLRKCGCKKLADARRRAAVAKAHREAEKRRAKRKSESLKRSLTAKKTSAPSAGKAMVD